MACNHCMRSVLVYDHFKEKKKQNKNKKEKIMKTYSNAVRLLSISDRKSNISKIYKKNLYKIRNRMTAHLIKRTDNRSDAVRCDL